jgi:hypothetical protein
MSFFGNLKTFFEAVGKKLEQFFGSSTVEQKVQGALTLVGAAIVTVSGMIAGPAASAAVSGLLKMIQTDYATICAVVQQGTPPAGSTLAATAAAATASLKANLTALLTDADVKNHTSFTNIQAEVTTILNELEAIEASFIPPATVAPATPAA